MVSAPVILTKGLVDERRQQETLRLLREAGSQCITRQELASKMNISLRTVDRSLGLLVEQGARLDRRQCGHNLRILLQQACLARTRYFLITRQ